MSNEKFKVKFGLAVGDTAATIDGTTGNIVTQGDVAVNGGDITTTSTTANIVNSTATTVNIGGDATTTNIGKSGSGKVITGNDLQVGGNDILTQDGTTALTFSNVTGDVSVAGDLTINGGDLITTVSPSNLFNTNATTVNIAGAATTVSIGANTGTTTVNNDLVADSFSGAGGTFGNVTIGVVDDQTISTTTGDLNIFPTSASRMYLSTADVDPIFAVRNTTNTNTSARALSLRAASTGTPAIGFGTNLEWQGETPAGAFQRAGYIQVELTDDTVGYEDYLMRFGLMKDGQSYTTKLTVDSAGNLTVFGGQTTTKTITGGGKAVNSQGNVLIIKGTAQGAQQPAAAFFDNSSGSRRGQVVVREYGQSQGVSPQTGTGTTGQALYTAEASRGTAASPLAPNTNNNSLAVYSGGYYDGNRWSSENAVGNPAVLVFQNVESVSSETSSFTGYISGTTLTVTAVGSGTLAPGQLLSAEAWTSTGSSISGTTLTIGTLTSGTIQTNQIITGTGVLPNTYIVSGSGSTWTISQSHTTPVTATAINGNIQISTLITAFGNDTTGGIGTYTVSVSQTAGSVGTPLSFTGVGTTAGGMRTLLVQQPRGIKLSGASRQTYFVTAQGLPTTSTINGVTINSNSDSTYILGNIDGSGNQQFVSTDGTKIYQARGSQNFSLNGGSLVQSGITDSDLAEFQGYISGNTLTVTSVSSGTISLGALVNASGIAQGTFINSANSSISSTLLQTTTADAASGSTTITVASATGFTTGLYVTGTGIPSNTTITAVNGTTITLSAATTAPLSTTTVNLYAADWTITSSYATSGQTIGSLGSPVNMVTTPDSNSTRGTNTWNIATSRKSVIPGRLSPLKNNDQMFTLSANGSNSTGLGSSTGIGGQIYFQAAEDFTPTTTGTRAIINTSNIGTNNRQTRFQADSNQVLLSTANKSLTLNDSGTVQFPSYTFPATDGLINQVLTTDGAGNVYWALPGGGGSTFGNVSIGVDTDQTISTTSGDLILQTAAGVNAGTVTLTAGTNGNITLAPNGTGNIALTLANGGNLTNTRNYVYGAIRNSTTQANGDQWSLLAGSGGAYRGITLDNSVDTTKRVGVTLRSYGISGGAPRNAIIGENARGTAASPSNVTSADRLIELIGNGYVVGGGTSAVTGWASDSVANFPAIVRVVPAEDWNDGLNKVGTRFQVILQPPSTTFTTSSNVTVLNAATDLFQTNSNQYNIKNVSGGNLLTIDSSGNVAITGDTIVGGDLRINGNDILASDGSTNITLNSNTLTTFAGNIKINGNSIQDSTGLNTIQLNQAGNSEIYTRSGAVKYFDSNINSLSDMIFVPGDSQGATSGERITQFSLFHARTSPFDTAQSSYFTWPYDHGTGNYSPIGANETLGSVNFGGQYGTGSSPQSNGSAAFINGQSAEAFTATANGGRIVMSVNQIGTTTPVEVLNVSTAQFSLNNNTIKLFNQAGTTEYLALNSTTAAFAKPVVLNGSTSGSVTLNAGATPTAQTYTLPQAYPTANNQILVSTTGGTMSWVNANSIASVYGQWQYDATITPAAANTAYAYPIANGTTDFANIASVGSTSRIIPGSAGIYKLQFSVQLDNADNGSDHIGYFWWRKNGTDVPNSMGQVSVFKNGATIAGWDNIISSANTTDYWELMYAVSSTQLTLPTYAATAFGPAAASMFITLVPVGA